jgi:hypothetical protein
MKNLYSIFDTVASEYAPPFVAINNGVAMRAFKRELGDLPDHVRKDYVLYRIGTFESETGEIARNSQDGCWVVEDTVEPMELAMRAGIV